MQLNVRKIEKNLCPETAMITLWHRHVSNGDEIALEKINFDYSTTAQCDARGNLEKKAEPSTKTISSPLEGGSWKSGNEVWRLSNAI